MRPLYGITGGIGSGKSILSRLLRIMGYEVYDCDAQAKRLMNVNPSLCASIKSLFGSEAYTESNTINNTYIATKVFTNRSLLEQLNALVHPVVTADIYSKASQKASQLPFFIESAILFNSELAALMDLTICVTSPISLRIARVAARSGLSEMEVHDRMRHQKNDDQLVALCDYSIVNDEHHSLIEQTNAVLIELFKVKNQRDHI